VSAELRVGIVGCGMMGQEHIRYIGLTEGARVTAIADPHGPSRDAAYALLGVDVETHEDYRALLAEAPVDALVVATPNHTHIDVLRNALKTELHVMVEKPLCTTVEDCREVVALAAGHTGVFWVGMEYRYMAPTVRLVAEVRDGAVGQVRMVAIREHRFPFQVKVDNWNRLSRNTGGTMVEKCCHFFDLMRLIVGARPRRVYASGGQDVNHLDEVYEGERSDIVDNAFVIVDFEGGGRALLDLCMFAEASREHNEIAVTGDVGKVECAVPSFNVYLGRRDHGQVTTETETTDATALAIGQHYGSTLYEHLAFQAAVRGVGPVEVTAEDGLYAVAIGVAAERSIAEGRLVEMSELGL